MFPPALTVIGVVAAAISTAGLLVLGRLELAVPSARLAAISLMVSTAVTVAGLVVGRSRWAQRHAWLLAGVALVMSVLSRPLDAWWFTSVVVAGLAAGSLGLRSVTAWVGSVDRRAPVPRPAVLLLLVLLDVPLLVAATHPTGPAGLTVSAAFVAWLLMWAYSQAWIPALWMLRLGLPVLVAGWGWGGQWWGWTTWSLVGAVALWAAWDEGSLLAVQPLEPRRVSARPILAELAPEDVRRVAGIDEKGRPQ